LDITYLTYDNDNKKVQCTVNSGVYPYRTTCSPTVTLGNDYILGYRATKTDLVTSDSVKIGEVVKSVVCAAGTSCTLPYGVSKEHSTSVDFGFFATAFVDTVFWSAEVALSVNTAFNSSRSIEQFASIDITPSVNTCFDVIDSQWTVTNAYMTHMSPVGSVWHYGAGYELSLSNLFVQTPSLAVTSTMTATKNVRELGEGYACNV